MKQKFIALVFFTTAFIVFFCGKDFLKPYPFPDLYMFPPMPVAETNPVTVEGANVGRHLFYDPILSADSTFSCSSCHKQEVAFSDAPNQFSKGISGGFMKRNSMPLFNLAWYPSLFWDGRAANVEEQVFHPVRTTDEMNMNWMDVEKRITKNKMYKKMFSEAFGDAKIDSLLISKAIAQFLRTLISYQSKYDRFLKAETKLTINEMKGFSLINDQMKGDCLHCHATDGNALGTTLKFSNNGLDSIVNAKDFKDKGRGAITGNEKHNGKFMIPSLRNIALTAPYMHDGRFNTLEEVLDFYSTGVKRSANIDSKMEFVHQGGVKLSAEEKKQIIAFLHTMTDSVFISNPEFSNPFIKKE